MSEVNFTIPKGVKDELQRGLRWHEEGHSGEGLRPATVAWARRMAAGDPITRDKVIKMRAWLARHQVDKQGEGFSPGEKGFPSPGRVSWALWGGDPAVTWSEKLVKQIRDGAAMSEGLTGINYLLSLSDDSRLLLAPSDRKVEAPEPTAEGESVADAVDPEDAIAKIARNSALDAADRVVSNSMQAVQAASIGGELATETVVDTVVDLVLSLSPGVDLNAAQRDTNTIFGLGRMQEARAEGAVEGIRSAMLESMTCSVCLSKDGARFPIEELDEYATPDPQCAGGDKCNCIVIFVPKES
jgi:hypothetical protein